VETRVFAVEVGCEADPISVKIIQNRVEEIVIIRQIDEMAVWP